MGFCLNAWFQLLLMLILLCCQRYVLVFLMKGNHKFGHPTAPVAELTTLTQAGPITLAQMS